MKLTKSGRVAIVDDVLNEVRPLLTIFSSNGVPFIYISGNDRNELPKKESNFDCRVLFLDLNLTGVTSSSNVISVVYPILNSIIQRENHPYILIVWSKKDGEYLDKLGELFRTDMSNKKPLIQLNLQKNDYFRLKTNGTGDYEALPGCETMLTEKLSEELKKIDSLELLIDYDNITHDSLSEILCGIFNLTVGDDDRNLSLKNIYYKLAEAFLGKQLLKNKDDIAKATFNVANTLLEDAVERNIYDSYKTEIINEFEEPPDFDVNKKSAINDRLMFGSTSINKLYPGTIYLYENSKSKTLIGQQIFDINTIIDLYCEKEHLNSDDLFDTNREMKKEYKDDFQRYWQSEFRKNLIDSSFYFELEVSPICDFAQDKIVFCRVLPGLILPYESKVHLKKSESIITLPVFTHEGNNSIFALDVRFMKAENKKYFNDKNAKYRLRHNILVDIQAKISKHINRPGLVTL